MGKTTGFLEHTRALPTNINVADRLTNYNEFINNYTPEKLNQQASRCMNCGVPFCHNGCPLGNIIPEFNDAVYQKKWQKAYTILTATNNFPEFTGRICPAPCEAACVLGINQPAVAIEEIEKHIIEIAFEKNYVQPTKIVLRSGKNIAIIGSGPAGLAAADQLNLAGHTVTIFEKDNAPGGLLRYGIPDFKLEKWVIDRRIKLMTQSGIIFKCNTFIGEDVITDSENVSITNLLANYDAIVLAGGCTVPRGLQIPGSHLHGVHFAMDFLGQQNKRVANANTLQANILATNKNVIVIGGGDTGSDCVGTSNRQKAKSVTQFELMPMPPTNRTTLMPWPSYPMVLKTTSSHEEGVQRQWATATKEFMGDTANNLIALKIVDLIWETSVDGTPAKFIEQENSSRIIPCELALLAMGFLHPQKEGLLQKLNIELDNKGNVKATEKEYQTNIPKIFTAGDMRRGQSLVVWAISEGRECAKKVDEFLMGFSMLESKDA